MAAIGSDSSLHSFNSLAARPGVVAEVEDAETIAVALISFP
jgi:hypothetical protein